MMLVDRMKQSLHRDIVSHPKLHAWVLNLYLNGESYPHRVSDYFPKAGNASLQHRLDEHLLDEARHVRLYAKAIAKLGDQPRELVVSDIYNDLVRRHTRAEITAARGALENSHLAHFFAHVHFIERRVLRSLEYHVDACVNCKEPYIAKALAVVASDEARHVRYTRDAVFDLLPRGAATRILKIHENAERHANRHFSARNLRTLAIRFLPEIGRKRQLLYRAFSHVLTGFAGAR